MIATSPYTVLRDRRGMISAYFAAMMTIMVILMVGALDLMRVSLVKSRAQSALDLAVLAAGRNLGADPAVWEADAQAYFTANMGTSTMGATLTGPTVSTPTSANGASLVRLDASVSVPLMISAFTQSGSMSFNIATVASQRTSTNLEMVLAIDTTGSMADGGKMASAQKAAKLAVTTLLGTSGGGSVYLGVVPFNETVNVGNTATTRTWLDTTTQKQPPFSITGQWQGCLMERKIGTAGTYLLDDTPRTGGLFKAYGATKSSKDKKGVWTEDYVQYYDGYMNPQDGCPASSTRFLTANPAGMSTAIDNMKASGSTMIASGLVWSWRMLSPQWRGTNGWGDATLPQNTSASLNKVVVLLTDGDNAVWSWKPDYWKEEYYFYSPFGNARNVPYTTNGKTAVYGDLTGENNAIADRLVWNNMKTTDTNYVASLCTRMKAAGIILFTIPFGSDISSGTATMLKGCASDSSKYLRALTDEELQKSYNTVIKTLSELTIIQ